MGAAQAMAVGAGDAPLPLYLVGVQAKPFPSKEHFFTGNIVSMTKVLSDLTIGLVAEPCIKMICFMAVPGCLWQGQPRNLFLD